MMTVIAFRMMVVMNFVRWNISIVEMIRKNIGRNALNRRNVRMDQNVPIIAIAKLAAGHADLVREMTSVALGLHGEKHASTQVNFVMKTRTAPHRFP